MQTFLTSFQTQYITELAQREDFGHFAVSGLDTLEDFIASYTDDKKNKPRVIYIPFVTKTGKFRCHRVGQRRLLQG